MSVSTEYLTSYMVVLAYDSISEDMQSFSILIRDIKKHITSQMLGLVTRVTHSCAESCRGGE